MAESTAAGLATFYPLDLNKAGGPATGCKGAHALQALLGTPGRLLIHSVTQSANQMAADHADKDNSNQSKG